MKKIKMAMPNLQHDSIVDGLGFRTVLWTQGCPHHCLGCHNPETWNPDNGYEISVETIKNELDKIKDTSDGLTLTGGEPFEQVDSLIEVVQYAKSLGLNIWSYTGYTYEYLCTDIKKVELLKLIDVLVDGKFNINLKSYDVKFRGSKNQRLINVQKSIKLNKVVEIETTESRPNKKMPEQTIFI